MHNTRKVLILIVTLFIFTSVVYGKINNSKYEALYASLTEVGLNSSDIIKIELPEYEGNSYKVLWNDKYSGATIKISILYCTSSPEALMTVYEEIHSAQQLCSPGSYWGVQIGDFSEYRMEPNRYTQVFVKNNIGIWLSYLGDNLDMAKIKLIIDKTISNIDKNISGEQINNNSDNGYTEASIFNESIKIPLLKSLKDYSVVTTTGFLWAHDSTKSYQGKRMELENISRDQVTLDIVCINTTKINNESYKYQNKKYRSGNLDIYAIEPFINNINGLSALKLRLVNKKDIVCAFIKGSYLIRVYYHDHQKLDKEQVIQLVKTIYKTIEL